MNRLLLLSLLPFAAASPVAAQPMDHSSMPGMTMPMPASKPLAKKKAAAPPAKKKAASAPAPARGAHPAGHAAPATPAAPAARDMSSMPGMKMPGAAPSGSEAKPSPGHDMSSMPGPLAPAASSGAHDMANMPEPAAAGEQPGHDMAAMPGMPAAEVPKTPPPPPPNDHVADRFYDPARMAEARETLRREHGATRVSRVMLNLGEYQVRSGGADGYRWEGQAWYGGDINRVVLKTEGEGTRHEGVATGEVQALYSRAVGVYTDVQAGVRQDFKPGGRTYLTVGAQTLFPYWFDAEGAVFLSTTGELLARAEGSYDLRLTNRWILQPRAELNFAAQDTSATRQGSGLSNAELGLRLRYEIRREFAPYVGVSYDRKFGKTADYARALGEGRTDKSLVVGVRAWF